MRPEREEVTGYYRKLHNEKLQQLYFSRDIIVVRKCRKILWAGHVTRNGSVGVPFLNLLGKLNGGDVGVDGRIILKYLLLESGV
jgi:hypothetical protein